MNPPLITELPYPADSASLFERIADLPWAIFLDSCGGADGKARYDILSAAPYRTLTTRGATTEIQTAAGSQYSNEDPFFLVKQSLGETLPTIGELPFCGGAIGYFGYDLARRLEKLPFPQQNLSANRSQDSMPEMAVGLYDWAMVVDHQLRRAWMAGSEHDSTTREQWPALLKRLSQAPIPKPTIPFVATGPIRTAYNQAGYAAAFARIQGYIQAGDCYQVNLAQRFSTHAAGDPWEIYLQLRRHNPSPFAAYLALPYGTIMSASPERFLSVRAGQVQTRPIKGTRPRGETPEQDARLTSELLASPKDRAENLMIVDLLRNDLGKVCVPGSVRVPELFALESFASVHHLVSTVEGTLAPGHHAIDLLRACFPGGSITGAPKLRAMAIIDELEPFRRGVYCGTIGYIGFDGGMDSNIAIRTALYSDSTIRFWAGGGIVADSQLEEEYREVFAKAAPFLGLLKQTQVGQTSKIAGNLVPPT